MPDAAQIRSWAREQGLKINDRGAIPADIEAMYFDAHGGTVPPSDDGVYDVSSMNGETPEPPPQAPESDEKPPRKVRSTRKAKSSSWAGKLADKAKQTKKAKPAHPRIALDRVFSRVWGGLANFARPLPPVYRTLKLQGPLAGVIAEDALRGTIVDKLMQPIARAEERGKALGALMLPPMGAMLLMKADNPMSQAVAAQIMREGLFLMCEVVEDMPERVAASRAREERHTEAVDAMMAMIFAEVAQPQTPEEAEEAVSAEEDAIKRAQEFFG